jgi:hypothetical protein
LHKHKALSINPSTAKKKNKKERRNSGMVVHTYNLSIDEAKARGL